MRGKHLMKLTRAFLAVLLAGMLPATAEVARPAPDFEWINASGQRVNFSTLKNQPAVILFARSPRDWRFRAQVGALQRVYERLGAERAICFAAFSEEPGRVRSNIPFVLIENGAAVMAKYEAGPGFSIAIIGRDGNLAYVTHKVLPGQRVLDVIDNGFAEQEALRRP